MTRIIKQLKNTRILLVFLLMSCSGSTNDRNGSAEVNNIFEQILPQVFDSLAAAHKLEDKRIVYYKDSADKLQKTILKIVADSLAYGNSLQASLIRTLNDIIQEPINLELEARSLDGYHITYKHPEVERLIGNDTGSVCILNLSPIAFDETGSIGCFYLALSCSKGAGRGYFIYIYKEAQWQTLAILQTWHV